MPVLFPFQFYYRILCWFWIIINFYLFYVKLSLNFLIFDWCFISWMLIFVIIPVVLNCFWTYQVSRVTSWQLLNELILNLGLDKELGQEILKLIRLVELFFYKKIHLSIFFLFNLINQDLIDFELIFIIYSGLFFIKLSQFQTNILIFNV